MNCSDFENQLGDYLDNLLSGSPLEAFEQHRRQCPLCAMLLENVRDSMVLLRQLPEVEPPRDLAARIIAATSEAPANPFQRLLAFFHLERELVPHLLTAALVVLFVVAAGYNFFLRPADIPGGQPTSRTSLMTMIDSTSNRFLTRVVKVYAGIQETWQSAEDTYQTVQNFFQTRWEQVKDVFRDNSKKDDKTSPEERKDINQSMRLQLGHAQTA